MLYVVGAIVAMVLISSALQFIDRRSASSLPGTASLALAPSQSLPATGVWSLAERELGFYSAFEAKATR